MTMRTLFLLVLSSVPVLGASISIDVSVHIADKYYSVPGENRTRDASFQGFHSTLRLNFPDVPCTVVLEAALTYCRWYNTSIVLPVEFVAAIGGVPAGLSNLVSFAQTYINPSTGWMAFEIMQSQSAAGSWHGTILGFYTWDVPGIAPQDTRAFFQSLTTQNWFSNYVEETVGFSDVVYQFTGPAVVTQVVTPEPSTGVLSALGFAGALLAINRRSWASQPEERF